MESDRKICGDTAGGGGISRMEKCRGVKFRKNSKMIASVQDSCYLKKEGRNDAKERPERTFKTRIRHILQKPQQETVIKYVVTRKSATQSGRKLRYDKFH